MKTSINILPKLLKLLFFLLFAIILDLLAYAFLSPCPACSSFSQFIQTPLSLSGPIIATLTSLVKLHIDNKGKKNVQ